MGELYSCTECGTVIDPAWAFVEEPDAETEFPAFLSEPCPGCGNDGQYVSEIDLNNPPISVTIVWETTCFECGASQTDEFHASPGVPHAPPSVNRCGNCGEKLTEHNSKQEYRITEVI